MDELIDEYVEKSKMILERSRLNEHKGEDYIYHYEINPNIFKDKCLSDPDFLFQYKTITHCINGLDKFYTTLFESLFQTVRSTMLYLILFVLGGTILLVISFIISKRSIKSNQRILNEMVDIIFFIPKSTINMVPQLKRFIETATFEED